MGERSYSEKRVMPDSQRLIDYNAKYFSEAQVLEASGIRRPPKASCGRCVGRGYISIIFRDVRTVHPCSCVQKPTPKHRKGNVEDDEKKWELIRKVKGLDNGETSANREGKAE